MMRLVALSALSFLVAACEPGGGSDTGGTLDAILDGGRRDTGPCTDDSECPGSYCNPGSNRCCAPADPPIEICGDRIDQNCDRRDGSCGDNDRDGVQACMTGEDPLGGCDCDDERDDVRPARGMVAGAPEVCDGRDNDCNNRVDEAAECCAGCASLGSERALRADICTAAGECDCAGEAGTGPCAAGMRCCAGGCTDVSTDFDNCGVCGAVCTVSSDSCEATACRCGDGPPCDLDTPCVGGSCG